MGDALRDKKKLYVKPANVECMTAPRINEVIWGKLPQTIRDRDRVWQVHQSTLLAATTAMAKVAGIMGTQDKEIPWVKEVMTGVADALAITTSLNKNWTKTRRNYLKSSLPDDFKRLASDDVPASTKWLFGDDLEGSIKVVEGQNRLAKKMEPRVQDKKFNENNKPNHHKKSRRGGRKRGGKRNDYNDREKTRTEKSNHDDRRDKRDFQKKGTSRY